MVHSRTASRSVTILGSTGSVGCSTLDLIRCNPDAYDVVALTAYQNVEKLAAQAREFGAQCAVIGDENQYENLKTALAGTDIQVAAGRAALMDAAAMDAEWVMASIVGAAGLEPTLSAVRRGAVIALANKECLVCAGELMIAEVEKYGATLLPVDSEHNAIFQVFDFDQPAKVDRVTLTASGGPFRQTPREDLLHVTPAQAVSHPNWDMGAKISVDSATMMNKGLELIEAYHLFPICEDQLDVVIHPQSVIHSMVSYVDGSVLAQLGTPDMRIPISFTLGWPDRMETPSKGLDLAEIGRLDFEKPDMERFPALKLTREALQKGGSAPTILNAANEMAVYAFLEGKIGFLDITEIVEKTLDRINFHEVNSIEAVSVLDGEARDVAQEFIRQKER